MLETILNKMRQAISVGDFANAEALGMSVWKDNQTAVPLLKGIGVAIAFQKRSDEAYKFFEKAYDLDPSDSSILYNMGTLSLEVGKFERAQIIFQQLFDAGVKTEETYLNYINTLIGLHELHAAADLCAESIQHFPGHTDLCATYISVLEQNNDLIKAEKVCEQVPSSDVVSMMKARIKRRLNAYDEAEKALTSCDPEKLDDRNQSEFYWEQGMVLEKQKKFQEAWCAFEKANVKFSNLEKTRKINKRVFWEEIDWLKDYAKTDWYRQQSPDNIKKQPAFFVGFPRSGTTLMEQIVKAHSQIVTTEEVSPLQNLLNDVRKETSLKAYFENINEEQLVFLRERFWFYAEETVGEIGNKQLLDKLPLNIMWVPIIRLLFPKAPIIVAYRDPRDVCISSFIQKFTPNEAMINFLGWEQTARTYDNVFDIWSITKEKIKDTIFEYHYEDLTDDYLSIVKALLSYMNLPYEDGIQNYRAKTLESHVKTPSYREVVNPINKNAVQRWQNYQPQIDVVMPHLEKWIRYLSYA